MLRLPEKMLEMRNALGVKVCFDVAKKCFDVLIFGSSGSMPYVHKE